MRLRWGRMSGRCSRYLAKTTRREPKPPAMTTRWLTRSEVSDERMGRRQRGGDSRAARQLGGQSAVVLAGRRAFHRRGGGGWFSIGGAHRRSGGGAFRCAGGALQRRFV